MSSSSDDVPVWMRGMTPAQREAELDERDRRLVAEAPPIRPEVIEMLRRHGFPFNRVRARESQSSISPQQDESQRTTSATDE